MIDTSERPFPIAAEQIERPPAGLRGVGASLTTAVVSSTVDAPHLPPLSSVIGRYLKPNAVPGNAIGADPSKSAASCWHGI
jgi:hypothetical protein